MNTKQIITSVNMILRMLVRRRIVLILLLVIPVVFLSMVEITAPERILPFRLASLEEDIFIEESEKQISLIFFAVAAAGFLMSFLALNLIQKDQDVNRRLVLSGYHPLELLISNLLALFIMIILIAVYVGLLTNTFFTIAHWGTVVLGLALTGFVYGCYGLLAGSLIRGELEGILLIVLLVNLDAGWLQNPLFYAEAQNQMIIRYLPAYYPSQVTIIAGFTDYSVATACINSLLYGFGLLLLSMLIFFTKMKVHR